MKQEAESMKILVLGATGMLGSALFKQLLTDSRYQVYGTVRRTSDKSQFLKEHQDFLISNIDVLDQDTVISVMESVRPNVVINCIGLIKQLAHAENPLLALPINAMLPHRLAKLCSLSCARLIHISTDCVFSGSAGMYTEEDASDVIDLYGKSKYLGEISDLSHVVTLRTSLIGHGSSSNSSLIDWFLAQEGSVKGYRKAVFSGVPTVELARVLKDYVLPAPELHGLYHVSAEPIDKCALLTLVAKEYRKDIEIVPDEEVRINRSLDSSRFRQLTGYEPKAWPELVKMMHNLR
jgi:dTDP-4-dehydrorhamnose reductase